METENMEREWVNAIIDNEGNWIYFDGSVVVAYDANTPNKRRQIREFSKQPNNTNRLYPNTNRRIVRTVRRR